MLKDSQAAELAHAVRVVATGDALLAPAVTGRLLDRFAASAPSGDRPSPALGELTARELEVLTLVAGALSNAERLIVTEATVNAHISAIVRKLDLRDRVQAVVLVYDVGLVRPEPRSF